MNSHQDNTAVGTNSARRAWSRLDWWLLLVVTALGGVLRFYQLGVVPPGFQFDEAFNAIDAAQVLHGNYPLFLPANAGREVLYTYFQAGLGALFGLDVYTLRLASALLGTAAVGATYVMLRRLVQRDSQLVATFTSLTVAVSLWHIHFSHYGIRVITMPLLFTGLFGSYWWGIFGPTRGRRLLAFFVSGLLTGLAVWTNPTGRLVPFVLIPFTLWLLFRRRDDEVPARRWALDGPVGGLFVTGVVACVVFLPLGLEFYQHPEWFTGHAAEVSIFAERVSGGHPWRFLLANIGRVLGMFSLVGDREWAHGPAGRPVFDPLMSIPFMIGLAWWGWRVGRGPRRDPDADALVLLALWSLVMLAPSAFSEAAPNYSRTLPALPAIFVANGLGLTWIATRIGRRAAKEEEDGPLWVGLAAACAIVVVSGAITVYDYFVRFPRLPEVYFAYEANKQAALQLLDPLADEYEIYLHPLWAEHPPVRVQRSSERIKALETADTLVLPPPGKGLIYAYPPELAGEAARVAQFWPGATVESIPDPFGGTLFTQLRLIADQVTAWPPALPPTELTEAQFVDGPTLLGMRASSAAAELWLYWRAEPRETVRDLTTFIHLLDAAGKRIGQADERPGNGLYPTNVWSPGERVIERYHPEINDPCAGGEAVQVMVGWYELAQEGARRPRANAEGDMALAGSWRLPTRGQARAAFAPANQVDLSLSPSLTLVGYTLHPPATDSATVPATGAQRTIDLYLQRGDAAPDPQLQLQLQAGEREEAVGARTIEATSWAPGEVVCQRIHFTTPAGDPPGQAKLSVQSAGQVTPVTELTLD